jgi:steroid 5-alpha reductase family enzyme
MSQYINLLPEPFLTLALASLALLAAFFACWVLALVQRDNGIIDILWGPGFAILALVEMGRQPSAHQAGGLLVLLILVWAVRLALYLALRHNRAPGEDARYRAMRESGGRSFWWKSLIKIYLLQALVLMVLALPIHLALLTDASGQAGWWSALGTALFLAGFWLEAQADLELWRFKSVPQPKGAFLDTGLRAHVRHPNYLGEAMLWFGLALIAFDVSRSVFVFAGPVLLTFLLVRVSGVAMMAPLMKETRPGYGAYMARVPALWPRWPAR